MENNQNSRVVKKGDFIELKFTGFVDGKVFDSNIEEDLKKISDKASPEKTIIIVGQRMVVSGLDNFLVGKEMNKNYSLDLSADQAFGPRRSDLVRIIPLKVFREQKITPFAGASFVFDNQLAKIITVSGARVITDFNMPLAGKAVKYDFSIVREVSDLKEKTETVCKLLFRYVPQISIEDQKIILEGPKILESFIQQSQDKFKEFLGAQVHFKEVEPKKEDSKEE